MRHLAFFPVVLTAGLLLWPASGGAQQELAEAETPSSSGTSAKPTELEEIVVTAQKRTENLQDVPIAISAFGQAQLEDSGNLNLTDVSLVAPNVILQRTGLLLNTGNFSIRGISFGDGSINTDAKTGVVMDGVVLGRNSGVLMDSFDIDRVEVLRGPQGTLFGRNNLAGTISMITTRPTGEFGGRFKATIGQDGRQVFRAAINTPKFADEKLRAKLSYIKNSYEGHEKNAFNGKEMGRLHSYGWRFTLVAEPTDKIDITVIADRARERIDGPAVTNFTQDPKGVGLDGNVHVVFQDVDGYSHLHTTGWTVEANWDVGPGVLTALGGWRKLDYETFSDFDARVGTSPPPPVTFHIGRDATQRQGSFELRFASSHSELFDYVLGAYYFKEVGDQKNLRSATLSIRDAGLLSDNGQDTESWALFGQTEIHVTDALTLVAGGRYTRDAREFRLDGLVLRDGTPVPATSPTDRWKNSTWKLGANYRAWEDTLLYASVSTGYKGGGYNSRATIAANIGPYDDEEVTSYEIGAKSTLLDNRLRVNVAGFYTDYEDVVGGIRRPGGNPTGTENISQNLGDVEIKGVELEILAAVLDQLTLTANVGWLDAEWDDFSQDLNNNGIVTDNSFLDLPNAPDLTMFYAADYVLPLAWGSLSLHLDARYNDRYNTWGTSNADVFYRPKTWISNASLTFMDVEERYSLSVYGRNLSDKEVIVSALSILGAKAFYEPPRQFGVELDVKF